MQENSVGLAIAKAESEIANDGVKRVQQQARRNFSLAEDLGLNGSVAALVELYSASAPVEKYKEPKDEVERDAAKNELNNEARIDSAHPKEARKQSQEAQENLEPDVREQPGAARSEPSATFHPENSEDLGPGKPENDVIEQYGESVSSEASREPVVIAESKNEQFFGNRNRRE